MKYVIVLALALSGCGKEGYSLFVEGECLSKDYEVCFVETVYDTGAHLQCGVATRIRSHLDRRDYELLDGAHCADLQD